MSTSTYVSHAAVKLILERYLSEDLAKDALVKIDPSRCVELPVPAERDWATLAGPVLRLASQFSSALESLRKTTSPLVSSQPDAGQGLAEALDALTSLEEGLRNALEQLRPDFEDVRELIGPDKLDMGGSLFWEALDELLQALADHGLLVPEALEGRRAALDTLPPNVRRAVECAVGR